VKRARVPDAEIEGRPHLAVRDEDRGAIEDVIADVLVEMVDSAGKDRSA
jgi:hypothetical protein